MEIVRFGVLSTAKIGVEKVIPAMQQCEYCRVDAIASRKLEKAQKAADKLRINRSYGSYGELLEDPDIDAIYNPMPNNLHVPWSMRALEAGKHVLCEKPIAGSTSEARKLLDASEKYPELKVMEAFMYRFHPQWKRSKELLSQGAIGELRTISSFFSYFNRDPDNIRNKPFMGGGGLLDIGCYCISLSRFLFEREPKKISGSVEYDPRFKVDRLASGILDFGKDGTSIFTCSTQITPHQRVNIVGTEGRIEIEIPFNAPPDSPTRIWLTNKKGNTREITFEICDQYTLQGDAFSAAILNDTEVPTPLDDAVNNMRCVDAVFESAELGKWVQLK